MANSSNRTHRIARNRQHRVRARNGSLGVLPAFTPDGMLAIYNANLDATLEMLNAALSTASRFQQL